MQVRALPYQTIHYFTFVNVPERYGKADHSKFVFNSTASHFPAFFNDEAVSRPISQPARKNVHPRTVYNICINLPRTLPFLVQGFLMCSTTINSPPGRRREYNSRTASSRFGTEQSTRTHTIVSKIPSDDRLTPCFSSAESNSFLSAVHPRTWYLSVSLAS